MGTSYFLRSFDVNVSGLQPFLPVSLLLHPPFPGYPDSLSDSYHLPLWWLRPPPCNLRAAVLSFTREGAEGPFGTSVDVLFRDGGLPLSGGPLFVNAFPVCSVHETRFP